MDPAILTVLIILGITVVVMLTELVRADLAAILMALVLTLAGSITLQEAFSGFSRLAVVTIVAVFILTQGLSRTGVTSRMGQALGRVAGERLSALLMATMALGAVLSLFMNNIAAAAVLMPAVMDAGRRARISPSKLLMPLSFSVNLGGTATLLATSNLLVAAALVELGLEPFSLLDFAPVGLPLAVIGIAYVLVVGQRLLPSVSPVEQFEIVRDKRQQLTETYAIDERLHEVLISPESPLVGKPIGASRIGQALGLSVLAVCPRDESVCLAPQPDRLLKSGDMLLIAGRPERVQQLQDWGTEIVETPGWNGSLTSDQAVFVEVIMAPRSNAAGHTLKELHFRRKYRLTVVAIWRGGRPYRTDVGDMILQFGDALLVHGRREGIAMLREDRDFLVLSEPDAAPHTRRAWIAATIMVVSLVAAATNLVPIAEAMMLGALAMVLTRCLTMDEAYRSIEWRAVFLVAGMLPAGIALTRSGAAEWLGELMVTTLMDWGPMALVAGMLLLAAVVAQVLSGQVAAVVLTPISVAAAQQVGANPYSLAMAVAIGCSMVYATPVGHPTNVYVMGPGGYTFKDYVRTGVPMTVLLIVAALILLPFFWPL